MTRLVALFLAIFSTSSPALADGLLKTKNPKVTDSYLTQQIRKSFLSFYGSSAAPSIDTDGSPVGGYDGNWSWSSPIGIVKNVIGGGDNMLGFGFGRYVNRKVSWEAMLLSSNYGEVKWSTSFGAPVETETINESKFSSIAAMIGGNFRVPVSEKWNVSFGAFIGAARNSVSDVLETYPSLDGAQRTINGNTQTKFAYMLSSSVAYNLTENVEISGGIWLLDIGGFTTASYRSYINGSIMENELYAPHQFDTGLEPVLTFGIKYTF